MPHPSPLPPPPPPFPAARAAVPAPQLAPRHSSPSLRNSRGPARKEKKHKKKITQESVREPALRGKSWLLSGRPVLTDRTMFVERSLTNITILETLAGEVLLVQHRS